MSKSTKAERAAQREAEMATFSADAIPPASSDEDLKQAARRLVEQIAAIGADHLKVHPYPSDREDDMRELAAAVRGLVPLFDAVAKVMESTPAKSSDSAPKKFGFLLRLIEGMLDVAKIAGPDAIAALRKPQSQGGDKTGAKHAAAADDRWRIEGLKIAQANQELSQAEIIQKIIDLIPGAPGFDEIQKQVRKWKKAGLLPILTATQAGSAS